ncbi:hypothetical protein HAX54_021851 [Datura stramonium]|uniref:Uncharacterized protein n=1 Tax=Datura stramonium TaxID=4076 RepID=A0ABS8UUI5_DATST|nr:hypothetical protein [Datura stramonium]
MAGSRLMEVEMGSKYARATNRLLELRTFAENLGENITLSLETDTTEAKEERFHLGNLKSNIEALCIKHINLVIFFSWVSRYESFLAELFGYFHPRNLLVRVSSYALKHNFIQVLLNELKDRNGEYTNRYKCSDYMSWHYVLKSFEILEPATITRQGYHQITLNFQWYNGIRIATMQD